MKRAMYKLIRFPGCVVQHVFDLDTIHENVRNFLYDYHIKDFLLYEKQEGHWRDLEITLSFFADSSKSFKS